MCSFCAIHRQKYARNSGAKVDDPLKLTTDASEYVVGAMLSQESDGVDMPIASFSKVMNARKKK